MNGLENALKVAIGLCFVIFICVISLSLFLGTPSTDELVEIESKYGYHDVDFDQESEEITPNHFQFLAYSYLANGDITVQIRYCGKEILFEKKEMEILINGSPCSCAWKVIKMNGESLNTLVDGDTLYLTVSVPSDTKRGDAVTLVYSPEKLVVSFIL
jgi:archaellum component FlaG (FlaF/FlaG flagellin family)